MFSVIIKEITIYLIRALNPVAFQRDRAKQIQMLKQIIKYLRISLNPVAFERDKVKQIQARDKQIYAKERQGEKKDKQIQGLEAKVEALLGATASDIDPLDFNTMGSMDRFFASEETKTKYLSDLHASVCQLFLGVLVDNVRITRDTTIIDAGCGFGIFSALIQEKLGVPNVRGFDFSSVAIDEAHVKHPDVDFFTHDIYDPLDGKYDVITCTETIEHLTTFYTTPGFTDEKIHVFLATGLTVGDTSHELDEFIEVEALPITRILEMIRDGEIIDSKSIAALLYVAGFCLGL